MIPRMGSSIFLFCRIAGTCYPLLNCLCCFWFFVCLRLCL
uniref:Uncharacterized protein n=1 Tax=Rhizophora mucronata TaxID=61149 RepID=A0A2P2MZ49_RHIMU